MELLITIVNILLGCATVVLSIVVGILFSLQAKNFANNKDKQFTFALAYQLFGEAALGLGTLVFAVGAYTGNLDGWSEAFQGLIRMAMFFATSATTLHLYRTVTRLRN